MVPAILIYLLKANIALTLFFLAYRFGLRRLTFYTGNRIFLLTGIAFSSLFPLISIDAFINRHEMLAGNVLTYVPDLAAWQAPAPVFTVWTLLVYLFWTGVSLMTIRFGIQLFSLWKIHHHSQPAKIDHTPVHLLQEPVNPFSFFRNIYINPSLHQPEELPAILRHEMVHVGQWHSVDVLLGELNNIFYWFNPGAWLMKTAIRENLEFITDRHLLKQGIDKTAYQYNLIKVSGVPYATAIANNFNFSHLKNRIIMMNSKKSSRYQVARYLVLGLLVGGTVLSLNYTKATSVVVLASAKDTIPPPPPPSPKVPPPPAPPKDAKLPPPPPAPPKDAKLPPPPPQNMISLHLDDPSKEPLYVLNGKIVPSIEYISPDGIASVDVLKGESGVALYGERGKNGVVKITTKKGAIAAVPVVLSDVKQVNVTDTSRNGLRINIRDPKSKTQGIPGNTLVLVDGKKVTQEEATSIPADKIQSMSVYKGGKTTMYKGTPQPNGVIAITLKGSPGATTGNAKDTGSVIHVYGGNAATSGVTTVTADTIFVK